MLTGHHRQQPGAHREDLPHPDGPVTTNTPPVSRSSGERSSSASFDTSPRRPKNSRCMSVSKAQPGERVPPVHPAPPPGRVKPTQRHGSLSASQEAYCLLLISEVGRRQAVRRTLGHRNERGQRIPYSQPSTSSAARRFSSSARRSTSVSTSMMPARSSSSRRRRSHAAAASTAS